MLLKASPKPAWPRAASGALGLYALVGGFVSFMGWAIDRIRLTDWGNVGVSIQPNSTVAVMSAGAALIALNIGYRRVAVALGAFVGLIGGSVLFEHLSGIDLGIDALLMFDRTWGGYGALRPGRMGPIGATSWSLIGVALLLTSLVPDRASRSQAVASGLALLTVGIASLSLIGRLYGASPLYMIPTTTVIALQTATFILAVSLGLIIALPEHGPMRLFREESPAGVLFRRIVPALIFVPLVLGYLRLSGERMGLYDLAFGTAARTLVEMALLLGLLWWTANVINRQTRARAQAEQLASTSERRFQTIFDSVAVSLWEQDFTDVHTILAGLRAQGIVDLRRHLLEHPDIVRKAPELIGVHDLNAASVRMFGADSKGQLMEALPTLFGPEAVPVLTELLVSLWEGRSRFDSEITLRTLSGTSLHAYITTIIPRSSEPWNRVLLSVVDLSDRKKDEEALREIRRQLESDLADHRLLQQLSAAMIHENDVQALYQYIVDTAVAIMQSQCASIQMLHVDHSGDERLKVLASRGFDAGVTERWDESVRDSRSVCAIVLQTRERVLVEDVERCEAMAGSTDLAILHRIGIRSVQTTPLVSRSGHLLGVLSTHWRSVHQPSERDWRLFDIVARQAADLIERKSAEDSLRDADRRKDEFLATLAHELRNPLAPIRNAIKVMQMPAATHTQVAWARDVVDRQTSVMARLLDDLLDVSRISRDKLELRRQRVELASLVRGACEMCAPLVSSSNHELTVSVPPDIHLDADPIRLGQVVGNLLNNACKYTEPNGRIWIVGKRNGSEVIVSVRDTGIGIPTDQVSQVFDMFSQVDHSREVSQGGLGIGLHLVKRLVEMHDGRITVHSDGAGKGSTFTVHLPAASPGAGAR